MSFELLEVPQGYETELALVVAPYFDPKFATRLIKELSPQRVRFVVDDGARPDDIKMLEKACGRTDVKVALAATRGIVHLKCFYFEFVKSEGRKQRKRRFLFGSANATVAAFSGAMNAELIADVELMKGKDTELLNYLENLAQAVEDGGSNSIPSTSFGPLRNAPTIYLPEFKIFADNPLPGFDSWLQRGLLVAKYKDAQQFLNVSVKLKKPMPKDQVEAIFADQGLVGLGARNAVRYPYISKMPGEEFDDDGSANWKAFYCVWTHFGEWMSNDCHDALGNSMQAKSSSARMANVSELLDHAGDPVWRAERRQAFIDSLERTWLRLSAMEIKPYEFLEGDANGISEAAFRKKFDRKLESDVCLANDDDFCKRYIHGYEFPKLPRFRQDTAAWNSFVQSFGESVAVEATKSTQSKVVKAIRTVFDSMGLDLAAMNPADITKTLRKSWRKTIFLPGTNVKVTVGDAISRYFR